MINAKNAVMKLNAKALGGAKIPHAVSNPVLHRSDDTLYIAAFIYVYKREHLQTNKMPRPIHWILADIETGDVVRELDSRTEDFSEAGFEDLYDLNDPHVKRPGREDFSEIYSLFDAVREEYLRQGVLDTEKYARYLERILEITPASYQRFYQELSNI